MKLKEYMAMNPEEKLDEFLENLSITNKTPDYFINWPKVYRNTRKFELHLNTLDYLIGKDNIFDKSVELFKSQPNLLEAIPSLLANRESSTDFIVMEDNQLALKNLDFSIINKNRIVDYVEFMEETGLLDFIQNHTKNSLVDFVYGVEAGLDTNARKNRSGSTMESIVENFINKTSEVVNIDYLTQASASIIKQRWDKDIPVDKANRRFDYAIYNIDLDKIYLVETNYYNGGGSKLKAVAGEFGNLNTLINTSDEDIDFIWITDGQGWHTAKSPMLEAFYNIDYILNLQNLSDHFLEKILILNP